MDYFIKRLSESLVYIKWLRTPNDNSPSEQQFIDEVNQLINEATSPQYFISDLRDGRIVNVATLRQLGKLTLHDNWGGSTAFSKNPVTSIMVGVFSRFARKDRPQDEIWNTPEEALAYLESLKPDITQGIDWNKVLNSAATNA